MELFAQMPIIKGILLGAVAHGASLPGLCEEIGIGMGDLNDSNRKANFEQSCAAWTAAMGATGDPTVGLRIGQTANPSVVGLIGHLMISCPTIHDAFQALCHFNGLLTNMMVYNHSDADNQYVITYKVHPHWQLSSPDTAQQAVDQALSGTLKVFAQLAGTPVRAREARLMKPEGNNAIYEKVLGCKVQFKAGHNALVFDQAVKDTPVVSYDQSLYALFNNLLEEKSKAYSNQKSLSNEIQSLLIDEFKGQLATIEMVAERLNKTPRTIQRILSSEGTTFRKLYQQVREEVATRLLDAGGQVDQISYLMGYSEASAFRRAFKSWKQVSPTHFQKQVGDQ